MPMVGGSDERMSERGQSTVEYLLVLMAFLAIVLAMGSLWHAAQDGRLAEIARDASSHGFEEGFVGMAQDLLAY